MLWKPTHHQRKEMRRRLSITSVLAAMGAAVLDSSSMNIAMPSIAKALKLEPSEAAWLIIAYQAALMASLLPLATIGDRWGNRRTFTVGICLFGASAVFCTLSTNFKVLILLRMLQGIGAAAVMSLGVALLRQSVSEDGLGKAIGWNAMVVALMSAAGPAVGAILLSFGDWQYVFLGGIVLSTGAIVASYGLPKNVSIRHSIDAVETASYIAIVVALVFAVGLIRLLPIVSMVLSSSTFLGIWLFVRRERQLKSPLLPLDLLGNPEFCKSVIASVACFSGLSVALLMLPFSLNVRLGADPLEIALLMTPWPLAVLFTTPITTSLLSRFEAAKLCACGNFCTTAGLIILAMSQSTSGTEVQVFAIALCGVGFGLFQTPNNRSMFMAAPVNRSASAGGLQSTARLTGQALGALLASLLLSGLTVLSASRLGFGVAGAATCAAGFISISRSKN